MKGREGKVGRLGLLRDEVWIDVGEKGELVVSV